MIKNNKKQTCFDNYPFVCLICILNIYQKKKSV